VVTRMDDVRAVLMDNETYCARSNFVLDPVNGAHGSMPVRPITTLDPPEHRQVRQLTAEVDGPP
jgi:cytochrome P450